MLLVRALFWEGHVNEEGFEQSTENTCNTSVLEEYKMCWVEMGLWGSVIYAIFTGVVRNEVGKVG